MMTPKKYDCEECDDGKAKYEYHWKNLGDYYLCDTCAKKMAVYLLNQLLSDTKVNTNTERAQKCCWCKDKYAQYAVYPDNFGDYILCWDCAKKVVADLVNELLKWQLAYGGDNMKKEALLRVFTQSMKDKSEIEKELLVTFGLKMDLTPEEIESQLEKLRRYGEFWYSKTGIIQRIGL